MPTRTELIPCHNCGKPRPIKVTWPKDIRIAATRLCMSCGNGHKNRNRHLASLTTDTLIVEFLIAGTQVKANAAERMAAVAVLTDRKLTASAIAARIHCTQRTVERHRAKLAAA